MVGLLLLLVVVLVEEGGVVGHGTILAVDEDNLVLVHLVGLDGGEEKSIETARTPMEEIFFILHAGTDIPSAYAAGMAGQEYDLQRI